MPFPPSLRFCDLAQLSSDEIVAISRLQAECLDEAWSADTLQDMIANQSAFGRGVFNGAACVCFCIYQPCADDCELLSIATASSHRGQGIAKALMSYGEAQARQSGFDRMLLEVAADNSGAIALYSDAGFKTDGLRKRYYRRPDGTRCDAVLMSKPIK